MMMIFRGLSSIALLVASPVIATHSQAFDDPLRYGLTPSLKETTKHLLRRSLQTPQAPIPAQRRCGQVIGTTPKEVIIQFLSSVTNLLDEAVGELVSGIIKATIQYDVEAHVVCSSCEQVDTNELSSDTNEFGFGFYCGKDRFLYSKTHSGLVFVPVERETGKVIADKKLKGAIFGHALLFDTTLAPSEIWPEDLAEYIASLPEPALALANLFNDLGGLFAAGAGVVSILPDYTGFGQAYGHTKSLDGALYRQATIPLWLESKKLVKSISEDCTELDNISTIGGYSEGGGMSFAVALSLQRLGVTILSCNSGAGVWNHQKWFKNVVDEYDQGIVNPALGAIMAYASVTYSSTNPDMANTNVGQDVLLEEWMNPDDFSMWAEGWISSDLSLSEAAAYLPSPNYLEILNPDATALMRDATAANISDPCEIAVEGKSDKICEAAITNDLDDEIASPPFPTVLCHSPDDEIMPYEILFPDVSASENLTEFTLFGMKASGSHAEAGVFCLLPMLLPFTSLNQGPSAVEQLPLDTCLKEPPTPSPPVPTPQPTQEPPSWVTLTPLDFDGCMEVDGSGKTDDKLLLGSCDNSKAKQRFKFDGGLIRTELDETKCLRAGRGDTPRDGNKMRIYPCDSNDTLQKFQWDSTNGGGPLTLVDYTDLCVVFRGIHANVDEDPIIVKKCDEVSMRRGWMIKE